jgi:uncharacterized protein YbjQ (UPF0145 family)
MLITTVPDVRGFDVAYIGLVSGTACAGENVIRNLVADLTKAAGGKVGTYERKLEEVKAFAVKYMEKQAEDRGANAIVGVAFDWEMIKDGLLVVSASGTAVQLSPQN